MTMRNIMSTGLVALALTLGGCDKGDEGKGDAAKTADAKGGDAKAGGADAKAGADAAAADGGDQAEAEADVVDPKVVKAVELAKKIAADPENADAILEQAGMDREAFNTLQYEVSQPELAEQYRLLMARES